MKPHNHEAPWAWDGLAEVRIGWTQDGHSRRREPPSFFLGDLGWLPPFPTASVSLAIARISKQGGPLCLDFFSQRIGKTSNASTS